MSRTGHSARRGRPKRRRRTIAIQPAARSRLAWSSVPWEIPVVATLWMTMFPLRERLEWFDIGLDLTLLAVSGAVLVVIRELGSRWLEAGWRVMLVAQLVCLLDCFTDEPAGAFGIGISASSHWLQIGAIVSVAWGFRAVHRRREAELDRLREAHERRRQTQRRFLDLVDTVDGIVWEAEAEPFRFRYVSRRAGPMLGFEPKDWIAFPELWRERIHQDDREWVLSESAERAKEDEPYQLEYRMIAAGGETVWVREMVNVVRNANGRVRLRGVTVDVTETKMLEQRLRRSADIDVLTGLANRAAFFRALESACGGEGREAGFAVLFLDLDRFKPVNDTFGHAAGDAVLVEIGRRLAAAVRQNDLVARVGGDEFAVLARDLRGPHEADDLTRRLRDEVGRPVSIGDRIAQVEASVGLVVADGNCRDAREILRLADAAMYGMKRDRRGGSGRRASSVRDLAEAVAAGAGVSDPVRPAGV